jgi:hypothetical protein
MIIYIVSRSGESHNLRTKVRNWEHDLLQLHSFGWYIEGVGYERPFDEFTEAFSDRARKIYSLFMTLNSRLRDKDGVDFAGKVNYVPCKLPHFPDMSYGGTEE